jgi:hypothetical protein
VQPPSLDILHAQLDPALECVGYQLAQVAERIAPSHIADEFSRAQLSLVKHLSRHISTLLETDFDVLTGLHTRASAQGHVDSWAQATSHSTGTHSVIYIDIDRLHAVNETRGFDAGDALIVRVTRLLREPHLPSKCRGGAHLRRRVCHCAASILPERCWPRICEVLPYRLRRVCARSAQSVLRLHAEPTQMSFGLAQSFQRKYVASDWDGRTTLRAIRVSNC